MEAQGPSQQSFDVPSAINVLVGAWLVLSPTLLGYGDEHARVNELAGGGLVFAFSVLRATRSVRRPRLSWASAAIGGWLVLSGVLFGSVNEAISGALVFVLAVTSAMNARERSFGT